MSDVILIGCSKQKASTALVAEDMYRSPPFRKRRVYAEATGKPWFILSAGYGLVPPERVIRPYDFTIAQMSGIEKREWALTIALRLFRAVGTDCNQLVEIHAGATYFEPLKRPLEAATFTALTPMKGLSIGQQLAWYGSRS